MISFLQFCIGSFNHSAIVVVLSQIKIKNNNYWQNTEVKKQRTDTKNEAKHQFYTYKIISPFGCTNIIFAECNPMSEQFSTLFAHQSLTKRYSKIDQYLARHIRYNGGCLSSPSPILCSETITPFSNSMISTNLETGL